MGNISSRLDESSSLYLKDQNRCALPFSSRSFISVIECAVDALTPPYPYSIDIVPRRHESPNEIIRTSHAQWLSCLCGFRFAACRRPESDRFCPGSSARSVCLARPSLLSPESQDIEPAPPGAFPNFILKLSSDDELVFNFTIVIRQAQQTVQSTNGAAETSSPVDTQISGLTYVYSSTPREVENLVTREFHADPNLHKNSNVELVGDFGTAGSPSVSFEWTWKWKPPKSLEDKGGGWRNSCSVRCLPAPSPLLSAA